MAHRYLSRLHHVHNAAGNKSIQNTKGKSCSHTNHSHFRMLLKFESFQRGKKGKGGGIVSELPYHRLAPPRGRMVNDTVDD